MVIHRALHEVRFGRVVVQDGIVVQVNRTERTRLRVPDPTSRANRLG